ncbi:MAG: glycosyltransferase family 39 protein [Candidatus Riflebacteria bacterium]|nr:glycosyltransferase family 39 protein [Candidatus Riflebacteria bacterium]
MSHRPGSTAPALLAVLTLALALRVGWVVHRGSAGQFPDTIGYQSLAESLLAGKGFAVASEYQHNRAPLFSILWAVLWAVFPRSLMVILLVQAVLSTLTVLAVHRLALDLTGSSAAALGAAGLAAIDPFQVFFVGLALSETLYLTLFTLALWRLASSPERPSSPVQAGALMGLAALTRATGLVHGAALTAAALLGSSGDRSVRVRTTALFVLGFSLVLTPWVARNASVYGTFVPVATGSGFTLFESNNDLFQDGPWPPGLPRPTPPAGATPLEEDRFYGSLARRWIVDHPGQFLARAVRRQIRLFDVVPHAADYSRGSYTLISAGFMVPLYGLAIVGFLRLDRAARGLVGLPVVATVALHVLILGSVRYRLPLMPIFCAVAGAALAPRYSRPGS